MASGRRVLRPGAKTTPTADVRPQLRAAADTVWDLLAPGFGPGGGAVLLKGDVVKASRALPDLDGSPLLRPYQDAGRRQAAHLGDGATLLGLLASGTVRAGLDERRLPGVIEGIRLARRQLAGSLAGQATPGTLTAALSAVNAELGPLADDLPKLAGDGHLDLDHIHVRCEDIDAPHWSPGLVIEPQGPDLPLGTLRVAVVERCVAPLPSAAWKDPVAARDAEDRRWQQARQAIWERGVDLLVCRKDVPDDLAGRLHVDGVAHIADAPADLVHRLEAVTGARSATQIDLVEQVGTATLRRDRKQWLLEGDGCATLSIPAQGPAKQMATDRAESWLRAVAPIKADARLLPGGGKWQRTAAADLRRVADHAPGHAPIGIQLVATVLDRIADAVVRNTGQDPSRTPCLDGNDAFVVVSAAVGSALSLAEHILRIDAAWQKRSSAPADLRGSMAKAGSPKGMPGDIPPLM